jgi:addiction module RelE/StbE family toxin
MRLVWRPHSLADRTAIMDYIAKDNPSAAITLDDAFETKAEQARQQSQLYKPGRLKGTREIVVQPNYVMVYRSVGETVEILRVLHTRQQWPTHR